MRRPGRDRYTRAVARRVLVLFPNAWDREAFANPKYEGTFEFLFHGTDLFSFPGNLQLITFDSLRFIDDAVRRFGDQGLDGVLSTDEYIGAICAAAIAQELGLPASDPGQIVLAQHKYYSRMAQNEVIPEASVRCTLILSLLNTAPSRRSRLRPEASGPLRRPFAGIAVSGPISGAARPPPTV
jgi:hypothetical protein